MYAKLPYRASQKGTVLGIQNIEPSLLLSLYAGSYLAPQAVHTHKLRPLTNPSRHRSLAWQACLRPLLVCAPPLKDDLVLAP